MAAPLDKVSTSNLIPSPQVENQTGKSQGRNWSKIGVVALAAASGLSVVAGTVYFASSYLFKQTQDLPEYNSLAYNQTLAAPENDYYQQLFDKGHYFNCDLNGNTVATQIPKTVKAKKE